MMLEKMTSGWTASSLPMEMTLVGPNNSREKVYSRHDWDHAIATRAADQRSRMDRLHDVACAGA
jgi:hypothetical protein